MARRARAALAVSVGLAVALLVVSTGNASALGLAPVVGFATADGFALPYYQSLLQPVSIGPGDLVFADTLLIEFLNFGPNRTIAVTSFQNSSEGKLYYNTTFAVGNQNGTILTFDLPSSTTVTHTKLCVDGRCLSFYHQTPRTLLPSGVLNVGGLLLLVFGVSFETFVLIVPMTLLARSTTRKALWSPKATVSTLLVLPHLLLGVFLLAALDYPLFDALFGGLEYIVFPPVFAVFYYFWALHLFNVAFPALVLKPNPQSGHRLKFHAWAIWVGELPDGTKVLVGTRWRDWLARLFGHFPVLVPVQQEATLLGLPAEAPLTFYRVETMFRVRSGRETPLDDFVVAGEIDEAPRWKGLLRPKFLYWVEVDGWLDESMPRLVWHRDVKVPAKRGPDGTVVEDATTVSKLSWPHYLDPPAGMRLAGIHFVDAPMAALLFVSQATAYKRLEQLRQQIAALWATRFVGAEEMAEEQMAELLRLMERSLRGLSDVEADEETRTGPGKAGRGSTLAEAEASERPKPKAPGRRETP